MLCGAGRVPGCCGGPQGPLSTAVLVLQGMPPLSPEKPALCAGCGGKISDRYYLLAVDKQWHLRCLKCCECKLALESELTCFAKDGSIYCKEDYYRYPRRGSPGVAACPSPAGPPTFLPVRVRLAVPRPGHPLHTPFSRSLRPPCAPRTLCEGDLRVRSMTGEPHMLAALGGTGDIGEVANKHGPGLRGNSRFLFPFTTNWATSVPALEPNWWPGRQPLGVRFPGAVVEDRVRALEREGGTQP